MEGLNDKSIDPSNLSHRKKQTWDPRVAFLAACAECGSIRKAAPVSSINRDSVRLWKRDNTLAFQHHFDAAQEEFREMLQDLAIERVRSQDAKANPLLLLALLNAHWPEKYRPNVVVHDDDTVRDMLVEVKKLASQHRRRPPKPALSGAEGVIEGQHPGNGSPLEQVHQILGRK